MVVDYQQGRIYKIVAPCGLTYYGSTTKRIMDRMVKHKSEAKCDSPKACTSKKVIEAGGEMFLVEMYPCNSEEELLAREGWYQRNRPCVNEVIAGRSKKEYYQDNREEINRNHAMYYQNNKQEINRRQSQPYNCECGSTIRRNYKAKHFRTRTHQRWVEQNQ